MAQSERAKQNNLDHCEGDCEECGLREYDFCSSCSKCIKCDCQCWHLWIDDLYDDPETPERHPPKGFMPARSSAEAITLVRQYGIPKFVSFDHDLGGDDNAIVFINWLIENYYDSKVPDYAVHSANPVGKDNIISKMESWKKSQLL